ncbi:MAG: DUF4340 domain-containing protein [Lentisphaeria bacterium]|nr:DUF4340 domain-containing protein [Lentisphaeria bacterium]
MKKESSITLIFLITAAILCTASFILKPKSTASSIFEEQGEEFYSSFTDPLKASELLILEFNEKIGATIPFNIKFENYQWIIPSHSGYKADAKDRMKKVASSLIGLKKEEVRSDQPSDHKDLGVIDPSDTKSSELSGRGTKVTLKDKSGQSLVSYIFGKDVEGKPGFKYVRIPGKNRTYATKVSLDFSTKFSDWVETNILEISSSDIKRLHYRNYSITDGKIKEDKDIKLSIISDKWQVGKAPEGKELDTSKVDDVTSALSSLKISGVRKKPAGLAKELKVSGSGIDRMDIMSLQSKGFYLAEGQLFSNEGELNVWDKDAVHYTIRFGDLFFGSGFEISAGSSKEKDSEKAKKDGSASRYIFIMAEYDSSYLKPVILLQVPKEPGKDADDKVKKEYETKKKEYDERQTKLKEWEESVKRGKEQALKLNTHFADWYYVISGEDYDKIKVKFSSFFKDIEKKEDEKKDGVKAPPFTLPKLGN